MVEIAAFLTELYDRAEEFCKHYREQHPEPPRPGPAPALSPGEVLALSVFGQWARFRSERDFYRFAGQCLRELFPRLPHRTQFNRQQQRHAELIAAFSLHLSEGLRREEDFYEALDGTAVATRAVQRRGLGWLPGEANIGKGSLIGWHEGFRLLLSVTPSGVITGFGFGPASENDRWLAESFFHLRKLGGKLRAGFAGAGAAPGVPYLTDKGFGGAEWRARWAGVYGAEVVSPPQRDSHRPWRSAWPKALHRWVASKRQIVESAFAKLHRAFRLREERPHERTGFAARLAAKVALYNFCINLNDRLLRPRLAFADLLAWV